MQERNDSFKRLIAGRLKVALGFGVDPTLEMLLCHVATGGGLNFT